MDKDFDTVCSNLFKCKYCLKFNAQNGYCDIPANVPECNVDDGSKRNCTSSGTYPVPKESNKYYDCVKKGSFYQLVVKHCSDNQEFDADQQKCVTRKGETKNPEICKSEGFIADSIDCSKYYYCKNVSGKYVAHNFFCPKGQIFNGGPNNYCEDKKFMTPCDGGCSLNLGIYG